MTSLPPVLPRLVSSIQGAPPAPPAPWLAMALLLSLLSLTPLAKAEPVLVINEFKSDSPGADAAEFLELYAFESTTGQGVSGFPLDGYVLVFFNGDGVDNPAYLVTPAGGKASASLPLDGRVTSASGFFVVGSPAVAGADLILNPRTNGWFQNGADGVGLYKDPASPFAAGTPATARELVDAVVYGTDDADDLDLLDVLTPGASQINETPNSVASLARLPDGGLPFDSSRFAPHPPSPGALNQPVAALTLTLAPAAVEEGESREALLSREGSPDHPVTVTFTSSDPGEVIAPVPVEIPAGAVSQSVVIAGVDDLWPDGTQSAVLTASAPGYVPVSLTIAVTDNGDTPQPLVLNEVFATGWGDANQDGAQQSEADRFDDEFVEIVNRGGQAVDLEGYTLFSSAIDSVRHTFPAGSVLGPGAAMVVFGGGRPRVGITEAFGSAWIQTASALTRGLYLLEPSGAVALRDPQGREVAGIVYDDQTAATDSVTLHPDLTGQPTPHGSLADGSTGFSPGLRTDGTPFVALTAELVAEISPARVSENAGFDAAMLTVRRPPPFTSSLMVMVIADDLSEAVPSASAVLIPAGQAGASLALHGVDDTAQDGLQAVTFTCIAAGHRNGSAVLEVEDDGRDLPPPGVFINEIDSDQAGADVGEFIELYVGEPSARALDGYLVVLFNGNHPSNGAYAVYDLTGRSSNASGYFVLGGASVPGVDWVLPNATLQNGADAVAIYRDATTRFTTGGSATPPTEEGLIDVVIYGNASAADPDLLAAFQLAGDPGRAALVQHQEGPANNSVSLARLPDATTPFGAFTPQVPTPGAANQPGLPADPAIALTVHGSTLVITYTGILQESSSLLPGSFAPVAGATSPHSLPLPAQGHRFFRAVSP